MNLAMGVFSPIFPESFFFFFVGWGGVVFEIQLKEVCLGVDIFFLDCMTALSDYINGTSRAILFNFSWSMMVLLSFG